MKRCRPTVEHLNFTR